MSAKEALVRRAGFVAFGSAVANPPVWILAAYLPIAWLAVTLLVIGSVAVGFVLVAYLLWAAGGDSSSRYRAAYFGAGVDLNGNRGPIWASRVYLLWGHAFKRRVQLRRIYALEREFGLDRESPFTASYAELRGQR